MMLFLSAWVAEEDGANTLSGNHMRNSITFSSCSLSSLMVYIPTPPPIQHTSWQVWKNSLKANRCSLKSFSRKNSFSNVGIFSRIYIMVKRIYLGFGLLVGQNNKSEDVTEDAH